MVYKLLLITFEYQNRKKSLEETKDMKAFVNNIHMAYDDMGNGPAILLLHGFPFNRKMWQPQLETFAVSGYRVIAPDLRGFGETPSGGQPFTINTHVDDIIMLMNYLGIGRAVVVAASTAGHLTLEMNTCHAHRFAASCFLSPTLHPSEAAEKVHLQDLAELVREGHHQTAIDVLCNKYLPEHKSLHVQQQAYDVRTWMETADTQSLAGWLTYLTSASLEYIGQTEPVHALVLTGENAQQQVRIQGRLQKAIIQTIVGAGHLVNLDKTGTVNSALLDFLRWLSTNRTPHPALSMAA